MNKSSPTGYPAVVQYLSTKRVGRLLIALHGVNFIQSVLASVLLRKEANKCQKIEDVVELCFQEFSNSFYAFLGWRICPMQVKKELSELLKIVKSRKPKVILEIGTANGGTLFSLMKTMPNDGVAVSIDLPRGEFGGGYTAWRAPFYRSFAAQGQKIFLIRADSHSLVTFNKVKTILNKRGVDFLFIDGDHTYEGVKKDFEMYRKLVNPGGIIALHDICPHPAESGVEVAKLWFWIKKRFANCEIIDNPNQGWAGIGLIFL